MRSLVVALWAGLAGAAAAEPAVEPLVLPVAGGEARLAGVHAPAAAPARAALAELLRGHGVAVLGEPARDRHGRLLAHLARDDGLWLQEELVRRGLAVVWTRADARERAAALLAAEAEARAAGSGGWAWMRIESPETAAPGRFAIVEGVVADAARVRGRVYVNFGADWKTDFTVVVAAADLPAFKAAGLDPQTLKGRRVRVRGWLEDYNGPHLEADHPEMVEVLDAPPPKPRKVRTPR